MFNDKEFNVVFRAVWIIVFVSFFLIACLGLGGLAYIVSIIERLL